MNDATYSPTQPSPAATVAGAKAPARVISDPREVAKLVIERMNLVTTRKDELSVAIHGLLEITQQLTRTYAQQLLTTDQLRRRVSELEAAARPGGPPPST
jgi:hypothetical protein